MNRNLDAKKIGLRLRKMRGIRTRRGVAIELGISYRTLTSYETGERVPSDLTKVKLADYYNTTVEDLFYSM